MKSVKWFACRQLSQKKLSPDETSTATPSSPSSSMGKRSLSQLSLRGSSNGGKNNNDSISTMPSDCDNDDVLELYRGEIEDLRRQLRESQEARRKEEEKEMEIVELRQQLLEAKREASTKNMAPTPAPAPAPKQVQNKKQDAEAVANAVKYLDEVIQRVTRKSKKTGAADRSATAAAVSTSKDKAKESSTPVKANKKVVQLEFCPTLANQAPSLESAKRTNTSTPPPGLDQSVDDSGSWYAAGVIKHLMEEDDVSSVGSQMSTSLHTAAEDTFISSMHTATGTAAAGTASSVVSDGSSWQPVGAMAALVADADADDSTINTAASSHTWMTAADDDFDDMKTCISALTMHTAGARSRGASSRTTRASTATTKDDSAVVVAELYRIQSLLCSVLKDKEDKGADDNEKDSERPSIQRISSRAKIIANLWEKNLDEAGDDKKEQEEEKTKKAPDKVAEKALTKESAEQMIASLALF